MHNPEWSPNFSMATAEMNVPSAGRPLLHEITNIRQSPKSPGCLGRSLDEDQDKTPVDSIRRPRRHLSVPRIFDQTGSPNSGSPLGGRAMRSSFNLPRLGFPPTKVRRTQSMFASPDELIAEGHSDSDELIEPRPNIREISTFGVQTDGFRRISRETLCELLDGTHSRLFTRIVVIDCRFEYEYEGGHIDGAININTKAKLEQVFVTRPPPPGERVLLVFHCEYSTFRGPLMAAHLRHCDRQLNRQHYPHLAFPDIVVLDGGYSGFYDEHSKRCYPQNYIGMHDASHRLACERELQRFKSNMRPRKTATFAGSKAPEFRFPR